MNTPEFVKRDGMLADKEYVEWLKELKARYRQSQAKAAVRVNTAMLEFYWSLGRDIIQRKAESKWGSGFFNQLSLDMRAMFPDEKGFSATNLKYIKRWYSFYYEQVINRQQPADEIGHQHGDVFVQQLVERFKEVVPSIRQQPADQLEMPEIFGVIPWFHHVEIFTKSKSLEEALFYIQKVATEGWSRALLEHHGMLISSKNKALPSPTSTRRFQRLRANLPKNF